VSERRGPKGDKGERGAPGPAMTRNSRRAVVFLFFFSVALSLATYVAATRYYQASQAAQQRQGQVFERKLCVTLGSLHDRKPPAGSPSDPSRSYLDWLHGQLGQLGPDVGCKTPPRRQP